MKGFFPQVPIRIPVKMVNGAWEFFYGGPVPVRSGAIGDLVVDKSAITDPEFLEKIKRPYFHKILDEGTKLLVALTIKSEPPLDTSLASHLMSIREIPGELGADYYSTIRSGDAQFVEVTIVASTGPQRSLEFREPGLWLRVQGLRPKGIWSSGVEVPLEVSKEPLDSLNHAFTKLSEMFEPWRKSHTGNIYKRVLYQEKNGKWYPLDVLRNAALAKDEHELIKELWAEITQTLNIPNLRR